VRRLRWLAIVAFVSLFVIIGSARSQQPDDAIMHPDQATWDRWMVDYHNAPKAHIDPGLSDLAAAAGSLSLLSHLQYTPSERNQASCGNCWVWGSTGALEVALDVQTGVKDRLSEQFLNSCASGYCACSGGNATSFAAFYNPPSGKGFAIPWSNSGAAWQDGGGSCSGTCSTIATSPNYPISSIVANTISTYDVGKATAIANIKNILSQNKAVLFGFYLPNNADWNSFRSFWNTQSESTVWAYSPSGDAYDSGNGAHLVLCVGYDDTDAANPYWIILNSWGAPSGRPSGLFRLSMNIDYNSVAPYGSSSRQAFSFQTLNVAFSGSSATCVPARSIAIGQSDTRNNGGVGSTTRIGTYPCAAWNESGPEYTYTFVPAATGRINASLSGMTGDLDLFVLDGAGNSCSASTCLAHGDSSATFTAQAGHTYRLVVDGFNGAVSNYTLGVQAVTYHPEAFIPIIVKQR
jgi:hypothetical protein